MVSSPFPKRNRASSAEPVGPRGRVHAVDVLEHCRVQGHDRDYADAPVVGSEHRAGGAEAGNAADPAAAPRAGARQPHVGEGGLDAPAADLGVGLRERPRQVTVKDVATGHRELGLELDRGAGLEAGLAMRIVEQALLDRLGEHRVERAQRGGDRLALGRGRVAGKQPRRHVQGEHGERLDAGGAELGTEDRRVGERMTVGLARRELRDPSARGLLKRRVELAGGLVDMKRAGERVLGAHVRIAQPWQSCEQQVELQLRALGPGDLRDAVAEDPGREVVEQRRRDRREHMPGAVCPPVGGADLGGAAVGVDRQHWRARSKLRARLGRDPYQLPGERAHPADRDVPAAGAAADHVVQKATVLHQARVVERRERADQRVGGDDSAHQIVAERGLEQPRQRRLEHAVPRGVVSDERGERLDASAAVR